MSGEACTNTNRVAICICTHSRPLGLLELFRQLKNIDLTGHDHNAIDLVIVDNEPSARTHEMCDQFASQLPVRSHYFSEPEPGITYARNRAVAEALNIGADFVAFLDDDDLPRTDWLIQLLNTQETTGADMVFGTWVLSTDIPDWAVDAGIVRAPGKSKRAGSGRRYGLAPYASTCNMLVSRKILLKAAESGPVFSHVFRLCGAEDKDFVLRAHGLGGSMATATDSIVDRNLERSRFTASGLLRRGFKNGCSQVTLARVHGTIARRCKLLGLALVKGTLALVLVPFTMFSRAHLMHNLYRMAKAGGVIFATATGRGINYYVRKT